MEHHVLVIEGPGPNAISHETVLALHRGLDEAGDRPVVLTGAGAAFSAGLNLKALVKMTASDFAVFLEDLERLAARLFLHPAPTVALINGHCVAGGYLLAACCDWRVAPAAGEVRFGLPAVRLGLQYPPVFLRIVRYGLSVPAQEEILLGAEQHLAPRALELGMVDELAADPRAAAMAWLERRAALPREAWNATKQTLRAPVVAVTDEERRRFAEQVVPSWSDPERIQRMLAAIGKPSGDQR